MNDHLTADRIARLRRRELPPPELTRALAHIDSCDDCAALARDASTGDALRVLEVLEDEAGEPPRHLSTDELFGWVDETLDATTRERVTAHLEECELCAADAADLQQLRNVPRRRRWMWLAAAAGVGAALLTTILLRPAAAPANPSRLVRSVSLPAPVPSSPPESETPPARYANAEWVRLVEQTLASGRLSFGGDLEALRGRREELRGGEPRPESEVRPAGVVLDDVRPRLTWPRVDGAAYTVSIVDGEEPVAQSEPLRTESWAPPVPLRRGRTYTWQVKARSAAGVVFLPAPPAPPARFRVLSASEHDELAAARRLHPDDHLLLAALYARAGMEREALDHLRHTELHRR